jgi:4'-phosphopantetheinyl transferase
LRPAAADRSIAVDILPVGGLGQARLDAMAALLDEQERVRASAIRFDRHRSEYIAAHALKRSLLSTAVPAVPPTAWRFGTEAYGKPRVVQVPDLHFTLTHCAGLVACAMAWDGSVGLDAEPLQQEAPTELVEAHFTPAEQAWLARQPVESRGAGFVELWVLKEAWIKATGLGLLQKLDLASFEPGDPPRVCFDASAGSAASQWHFRRRRLPGHVLALGWQGDEREVRWRVLDENGNEAEGRRPLDTAASDWQRAGEARSRAPR